MDALIVGALGAWDPCNECVLRTCGIGRQYAQLMQHLMVSDTIRWSRDIYIEHITGHRQYQEASQMEPHLLQQSCLWLLKKVIQIRDTYCLLLFMDIFKDEDRKLMQTHCHSRAMTILKNKQGDTYVKEAIANLSFAIIASGYQK
ncbi:Tetratricopeptide repeat protein 34 [Chelonia mydas]|uniref:Tetratricopeptide repeat protein 34 n=1 Tax=Chelonia mydas TaxID=8469 RepID=M7AU50_CHEMY|nr:Tetratricopeptide repeat protein 34 [Chelonia mydas]